MSEQGIARRYAQALFALAEEKNSLAEIEKIFKEVVDTVENNQDLKQVMYHQLVPAEEKKEIFKAIFSEALTPLMQNFFMLLLDKRRERYLVDIYKEFMLYTNQVRNLAEAEVKSAVPLLPKDIEDLQKKLEAATGKNVRLEVSVDPSLIGGVVLRIGDRVIDGSVATRLQQLRNTLMQATLGK